MLCGASQLSWLELRANDAKVMGLIPLLGKYIFFFIILYRVAFQKFTYLYQTLYKNYYWFCILEKMVESFFTHDVNISLP